MIKEIKRAVFSYRFLMITLLSILLMSLSSYLNVWRSAIFANTALDLTQKGKEWVILTSGNKFNIWNQSFKFMSIIYPIVITLSYIHSYVEEYKNNFRICLISRQGIKKYSFYKVLAIGLISSLVLIVPEIIYNVLLVLFANNSQLLVPFDYPVYGLMSELYTSSPNTYILLSIGLHGILGFSLGIFSVGISFLVENKVSTITVPFLCLLAYDIIISFTTKSNVLTVTAAYKFMFTKDYNFTHFSLTIIVLITVGLLCVYFKERHIYNNG